MTSTIAPGRLTTLDPEGAAAVLRDACRARLAPPGAPDAAAVLDRAGVQRLIPHRDPFLFVDRVDLLDPAAGVIAAAFDLGRSAAVFAGHFPDQPVWPGVLQIEAIAQAGCVLCAVQRDEPLTDVAATHILGARFVRPIRPGAPLEIVATGVDEGLFYTVVGQCLQHGEVCSAAVLSAYTP
jgi:3-hydroxyacyl-[acyl-carrier-protein] dehydratase